MSQVAKLFNNGRSQAVRLPAAYHVAGLRDKMMSLVTGS